MPALLRRGNVGFGTAMSGATQGQGVRSVLMFGSLFVLVLLLFALCLEPQCLPDTRSCGGWPCTGLFWWPYIARQACCYSFTAI